MKGAVRRTAMLDWLPAGATVLSVAACYGTLLVLAGLSALGASVALDEAAWSGFVAFFTLAALAGVLLGCRRHGALGTALPASLGAALILWVLFVRYHWLAELAGFAALALDALWDWRLKRAQRGQVRPSSMPIAKLD